MCDFERYFLLSQHSLGKLWEDGSGISFPRLSVFHTGGHIVPSGLSWEQITLKWLREYGRLLILLYLIELYRTGSFDYLIRKRSSAIMWNVGESSLVWCVCSFAGFSVKHIEFSDTGAITVSTNKCLNITR